MHYAMQCRPLMRPPPSSRLRALRFHGRTQSALWGMAMTQPSPATRLYDELAAILDVSVHLQQKSAHAVTTTSQRHTPCILIDFSAPCRGGEYCDERVCLSECLSVGEHISGTIHVQASPNFCARYLWPWLGPLVAFSDSYKQVMDDVISAHIGQKRPNKGVYSLTQTDPPKGSTGPAIESYIFDSFV